MSGVGAPQPLPLPFHEALPHQQEYFLEPCSSKYAPGTSSICTTGGLVRHAEPWA